MPSPDPAKFPFGDQRFTSLSAGTYVCAVRADRTVGCTDYGYRVRWWPHIPDGEFESVSAGFRHMCGVRVGGELACWRNPYYDVSAVLSPPEGAFQSVSVGGDHACAVRVDQQVVCWGEPHPDYDFGQTSPPEGPFRSVAVARSFSCGLRTDGEVECWGLRQEDPQRRATWFQPLQGWNWDGGVWPQGSFTALSVDWDYAEICALRASGQIVCWNNGTATHKAPDGSFVAVDAGSTATCGLRHGGEDIECWGYDPIPYIQRFLPEWDPLSGPFTAVSVGNGYACALRPDGEAACWGRGKLRRYRVDVDETPTESENRSRLEPPPGSFTAISAFDESTCALRPDGEAACWGMFDTHGEDNLSNPPAGRFTAISAGDERACGLRPNSDITCWSNYSGATTTIDGPFASLPVGGAASCGLRPAGTLACADADDGVARNSPNITFRSIATHANRFGAHACGLDHDGEITCWSSRTDWHEPTPPGPFTAVTVGESHSCGLRPDGTAECWTPHWPPSADPAHNTPDNAAPGE